MVKLLAVMIGGGAGAVCRYLLFLTVQRGVGLSFPLGTLTVNLVGSLAIGVLWSFFEGVRVSHETRLLVFTGFLGGFTTFSTYAREMVQLFKAGYLKSGMAYLFLSNFCGIVLVFVGYWITKRFLTHFQSMQ